MAVLIRSLPSHRTTINNKAFTFTVTKSLFLFSVPLSPLLPTSRCHFQNPNFSSTLSLRRCSALPLRPRPGRCLAAKPGRPSPDSDPNSELPRGTGFEESLSKFQDRAQIFFAVLFWMSLFFWTCVWDDRNRPNNSSRFRR